jgi:dipeptide/tripeptide permease
MNLGITFYPIYGITLGINYCDSTLMQTELEDGSEEHVIQILLLFFGINIFWYSNGNQSQYS